MRWKQLDKLKFIKDKNDMKDYILKFELIDGGEVNDIYKGYQVQEYVKNKTYKGQKVLVCRVTDRPEKLDDAEWKG